MKLWLGSGAELPEKLLSSVVKLIRGGGALADDGGALMQRLQRSHRVAIYLDDGAVCATASLKEPAPNYRKGVFEKAGILLSDFSQARELGYVVVDDDFQGKGLASKLVTALINESDVPCYATTDSDRMARILEHSGFLRQGEEWKGQRGMLSLWLRQN